MVSLYLSRGMQCKLPSGITVASSATAHSVEKWNSQTISFVVNFFPNVVLHLLNKSACLGAEKRKIRRIPARHCLTSFDLWSLGHPQTMQTLSIFARSSTISWYLTLMTAFSLSAVAKDPLLPLFDILKLLFLPT